MAETTQEMLSKAEEAIALLHANGFTPPLTSGQIEALAHAALSASPPPPSVPVGVAVKPLEWRQGYCDDQVKVQLASTLPVYQVQEYNGVIWLDVDNDKTAYPSIDEAKAAAQSHWVTAHAAAFGEVSANFMAIATPPTESALTESNRLLTEEVERLRAAIDASRLSFEAIREILIHNLDEPERKAFWLAVQGRDDARAALAKQGGDHD